MTLREALVDLAIATAAGALVGAERQQAHQGQEEDFGGVRTFPLVAVLGAAGALLEPVFGPWLLLVLFLGVTALLTVSHARQKSTDPGISSEIAALVTFAAGALAASHSVMETSSRYLLVAAIAAITMGLLAMKKPLHGFVARMSSDDVYATAKFVIVALVVIPLLPNRTFGPLDVINPFKVGVMIALVAGISFAGYVATRVLGGGRGLLVTGLVGGLASSTAVTLTFAGRTKEEPRIAPLAAVAIGAASATMFARVLVVVAFVEPSLVAPLATPLILMAVVGMVAAGILYKRDASKAKAESIPLRNPFELKQAVKFGLLYGAVLFAAKAAQVYVGSGGVLVSAVLAGLTDVDAITLSLSELHRQGTSTATASLGIVLAAISNTVVKATIATVLGGAALGRRVVTVLGAAVLLGGAAALVVASLV